MEELEILEPFKTKQPSQMCEVFDYKISTDKGIDFSSIELLANINLNCSSKNDIVLENFIKEWQEIKESYEK